jgi:excisionase family DNA binding protein
MTGASNETEPFITAKEAASYTGYSLGSIYGMVHRGEIPFHRRGKGVGLRFRRSELDAWLKGEDGTKEGAA